MIHSYKLSGMNIVLDIYSGSVHVVDEVAFDIINMYETSSKEEITKVILERYKDREDVTEADIEGFQRSADFMYEAEMIESAFDVKTLF